MPISVDSLMLGEQYDRPYLASLWSFQSHQAISRGIVTPRASNMIILFITHEKQASFVQYLDHFEDDVLYMEGETNHANDERLINAAMAGDRIYLFFRERHHRPFIYYGQVSLIDHQLNTGTTPSRFSFRTFRFEAITTGALLTEEATHGTIKEPGEDFIPDVEGREQLRRHVSYERSRKNRARAIALHGWVCDVCGFDFDAVYGEDFARSYIEIHHVKSLAQQGVHLVDPATDLIPLCSNCHSMAHRRWGQIVPIEELKQLVRKRSI